MFPKSYRNFLTQKLRAGVCDIYYIIRLASRRVKNLVSQHCSSMLAGMRKDEDPDPEDNIRALPGSISIFLRQRIAYVRNLYPRQVEISSTDEGEVYHRRSHCRPLCLSAVAALALRDYDIANTNSCTR